MNSTIDETLLYILFLTRHIKRGNVSGAILAMLMELRFPDHMDGFSHLRSAIYLRFLDRTMRFGAIYQWIAERCDFGTTEKQVEQDIREVLLAGWTDRDERKWRLLLLADKDGTVSRPTNGKFISRFGCLMELWNACSEEGCYAG